MRGSAYHWPVSGVSLDLATRVEGGDGGYSMRLAREWEIWGPNGGYLAAIALRAAGMEAEIRRPVSFYCHFLRSPDFDLVELDVSVLRRGRRSESLAVSMHQRGEAVLQALVRTAAQAPGYEHQQTQMPAVPAPATLLAGEDPRSINARPPFPFWENIERLPIDQRASSEPGAAIAREWARFRPQACFADPFVDAARPLILLDTFGWPAAYRMYRDRSMIAPNLDTSTWFHRFGPHSEWLLIDHECTVGHGGLLGVSGRVWGSEGDLLASGGAQLCCLPAPRD